jgi:hypothetical protein
LRSFSKLQEVLKFFEKFKKILKSSQELQEFLKLSSAHIFLKALKLLNNSNEMKFSNQTEPLKLSTLFQDPFFFSIVSHFKTTLKSNLHSSSNLLSHHFLIHTSPHHCQVPQIISDIYDPTIEIAHIISLTIFVTYFAIYTYSKERKLQITIVKLRNFSHYSESAEEREKREKLSIYF